MRTSSSASVGWRASRAQVGHTVAHVPQPTHRSESTTTSPSSMEMAPEVQAWAQRRQLAWRLRTQAQR